MKSRRGFADRHAAGRRLGDQLAELTWREPVVLGLARGGVPVAAGVARALGAPLEVVVARKIGAPDQRELAVGAVTADGAYLYDDEMLEAVGVSRADMADQRAYEVSEARRRQEVYGIGRPADLAGRDAIVVDDGLATGLTAIAAVRSVRGRHPRSVTVAVPVASPTAAERLGHHADAVYTLLCPPDFRAVGGWYRDFHQVDDDEVRELLEHV